MVDLQNFDEAMLLAEPGVRAAPPVVFLLATYGEGEPTDNARGFCKWLKTAVKKSRHTEPLQGLRVAVFGLGDRRYEQFNSVAVLADKQLAQLGADRLLPLGLGDDAQDLAADFSDWSSAFWAAVDGCSGVGGGAYGTGRAGAAPAVGAPGNVLQRADASATSGVVEEEDAAFEVEAFASEEEALAAMPALPLVREV